MHIKHRSKWKAQPFRREAAVHGRPDSVLCNSGCLRPRRMHPTALCMRQRERSRCENAPQQWMQHASAGPSTLFRNIIVGLFTNATSHETETCCTVALFFTRSLADPKCSGMITEYLVVRCLACSTWVHQAQTQQALSRCTAALRVQHCSGLSACIKNASRM